jgi:hypothetical protein
MILMVSIGCIVTSPSAVAKAPHIHKSKAFRVAFFLFPLLAATITLFAVLVSSCSTSSCWDLLFGLKMALLLNFDAFGSRAEQAICVSAKHISRRCMDALDSNMVDLFIFCQAER